MESNAEIWKSFWLLPFLLLLLLPRPTFHGGREGEGGGFHILQKCFKDFKLRQIRRWEGSLSIPGIEAGSLEAGRGEAGGGG